MNFHRVEFEILLPGDYNRDGRVDAADYTMWRNSLGTNRAAADGDGNGIVNNADYAYWKSHFGNRSRVSALAPARKASSRSPLDFSWHSRESPAILALDRRRAGSPPSAN